MAATVIDSYADELESYIEDFERMEPTLSLCGVRVIPFVVTLASQAAGEDIALAVIPKGCRILLGEIVASATLANSAQISIGIAATDGTGVIDSSATSDSTTFFKAAAVQSTTKVGFALTSALNFLYKTEKEVYLTCTTSVGTVSTEVMKGYVMVAQP